MARCRRWRRRRRTPSTLSVAARAPSFGFRRRFWPVLLVTRMRSTVGLKSKPKAVPLNVKAPALPIWVAAPVGGVQAVQATAAAEPVQRLRGRPEVDAEDLFAGLQAGDRDRRDRAGARAVEAEQAVRRRQADQRFGGGGGRQAERERAQEGSERECCHRVLEWLLVSRPEQRQTKEQPRAAPRHSAYAGFSDPDAAKASIRSRRVGYSGASPSREGAAMPDGTLPHARAARHRGLHRPPRGAHRRASARGGAAAQPVPAAHRRAADRIDQRAHRAGRRAGRQARRDRARRRPLRRDPPDDRRPPALAREGQDDGAQRARLLRVRQRHARADRGRQQAARVAACRRGPRRAARARRRRHRRAGGEPRRVRRAAGVGEPHA